MISVVIPTLARRDALTRCLQRLATQTDPDMETILVLDQAAPDPDAGARALAAAGLRDARLLQADRPGASAARNTGWRAARGDVVVFLDDDVLADPGLVTAHRAIHDARPEPSVGAIGMMRWASGLKVTPFMRWIEDGIQFDYTALRDRQETGWWHLYTCNCSLKRSALAEVGGLDATGFPFGYEDLDLARRIDEAIGLTLVVARDATAEHEHTMTLEQWTHRVRRIAPSERRFVARYPDAKPHFHDMFAHAAAAPAVRGRAARLVGLLPRKGRLGISVWMHAEQWWSQQLAPHFLEAWEAAAGEDPGPPPVKEPLHA